MTFVPIREHERAGEGPEKSSLFFLDFRPRPLYHRIDRSVIDHFSTRRIEFGVRLAGLPEPRRAPAYRLTRGRRRGGGGFMATRRQARGRKTGQVGLAQTVFEAV